MNEVLKRQVVAANRLMQKDKLSDDAPGSITAIDRKTNEIIICPLGVDAKVENLIFYPLDEKIDKSRLGGLPADIALHIGLYKKYRNLVSIVHISPLWCSSFSRTGKSIPICDINSARKYGAEIPCIGNWNRKSTDSSLEEDEKERANTLLDGIPVEARGAALIRGDGLLSWAENPMMALNCAQEIDALAQKTARAEMLGTIERIPAETAQKYHAEYLKPEDKESDGLPGTPVTEDDQKKINLELLIYFDKVCRENGINYSITGGTLLGAVRHGGFIPWDDDVDVFLARPEYEKLEGAFKNDGRFIFANRNTDPNFNFVYSRVLDTRTHITVSPNTRNAGAGLFLDICVVDGLPNNRLLRKLHMAYMRALFRCCRVTIHNWDKAYTKRGPLVMLVKRLIRRLTTHRFWSRRMLKAMDRYSFEKSKYVGNFTSQYGAREMLHKEAFDSYFDIEFEGHTFMACQGYEEYLTNIYGNYLSFPSKKERKGHHSYDAYWI